MSFWAVTQISATIYAMLLQLKLPFALLASMCVLRNQYSSLQVSSVLYLCIACINISWNDSIVVQSSSKIWRSERWSSRLSFSSFYAECICRRCLKTHSNRFGSEIPRWPFFSIPFLFVDNVDQWFDFDIKPCRRALFDEHRRRDTLAAIMLLYVGTLSKTIASSLSMVFITVFELLHYNKVPTHCELSFYAICVSAVLFYSNDHSSVHMPSHKNIDEMENLLVINDDEAQMKV